MVNVQKFSIIPAAGKHYTNIFNPNTDNVSLRNTALF